MDAVREGPWLVRWIWQISDWRVKTLHGSDFRVLEAGWQSWWWHRNGGAAFDSLYTYCTRIFCIWLFHLTFLKAWTWTLKVSDNTVQCWRKKGDWMCREYEILEKATWHASNPIHAGLSMYETSASERNVREDRSVIARQYSIIWQRRSYEISTWIPTHAPQLQIFIHGSSTHI